MKKIKSIMAVVLAVVMMLTATPVFAASIGSVSNDLTIGEDTVQRAQTTYDEVGIGTSNTAVYLTVDDSNIIVGVPTKIIVSGTPDKNGNYYGDYSITASGDTSGNSTLTIEPDSYDIELQQTGKDNVPATITQEQTTFTSAELSATANTTGRVNAVGLTAGSWNSEFSFVIRMETAEKYVYYSSLALAVTDANNLTIENADVKAENINDAVAALAIDDENNVANIIMMSNSTDTPTLTVTQDTNVDLADYTVTFANGSYLTTNSNLSITNGNIVATDSAYVISSTSNTSTLTLNELNITETANSSISTNASMVYSNAVTNNIKNVNYTLNGTGNSSKTFSCVKLINIDATNSVVNNTWDMDITKASLVTGIVVGGDTTVDNPNIALTTSATLGYGIGANTANSVTYDKLNVNNAVINVTTSNASSSVVGMNANSKTGVTTLNGANISVSNKQGGSGTALNLAYGDCIINSTDELPVNVYGSSHCVQTTNRNGGTTTINGGTYTSCDHTAYVRGSADIYDATFYNVDTDDYTNAQFGFYCGSARNGATSNTDVVNLYNCTINNANNKNLYGICSNWNVGDNGYIGPAEINLYDCEVYGGSKTLFIFRYVYSAKVTSVNTKFNVYGDTKLYYNDGTEITKDELADTIDTWKTTFYWNEASLENTVVGNKIIAGTANQDAETGELTCWNAEDANVYDYRDKWCVEGGSKHVIDKGIGWYSTYDEAEQAALNILAEDSTLERFEVQQCDCGLYTAYVS